MNTIEILQKEKSILLNQFNEMAKVHKKTYGNIDISEPKSEQEKISEKNKLDVINRVFEINRQIKNLK